MKLLAPICLEMGLPGKDSYERPTFFTQRENNACMKVILGGVTSILNCKLCHLSYFLNIIQSAADLHLPADQHHIEAPLLMMVLDGERHSSSMLDHAFFPFSSTFFRPTL